MGIFSRKQHEVKNSVLDNENFSHIINSISILRSDIAVIKTEIENLRTMINSVNGRINRNRLLREDEREEDIKTEFPFRNLGGGLSWSSTLPF